MDKVGTNCTLVVASHFFDRARGFLAPRPPNTLLLIAPCCSVHTFGMRFPLDVAFIGKGGKVLKSWRCVKPGKVLRCRGATGVLERESKDEMRWYIAGEDVELCLEP